MKPDTASASDLMVHATCVSVDGMGVLITGRPGTGKSSLALALIDGGGCGLESKAMTARLVADDQVVLTSDGGHLAASAPAALFGKLELRGLGIVPVDAAPAAKIVLVVDLSHAADIDRLPATPDLTRDIAGIRLPAIRLAAHSAIAPALVRAGLSLVRSGWFGVANGN